VQEASDGKGTITEWKTDVPLPVVGFSLGDFAMKEDTFGSALSGKVIVDAYANKETSDTFTALAQQGASLGTLSTLPMLETELSQGRVAAQIYTDYFGPLSFDHISLTQQAACNYGQSWPMLVYLPVCGFFDTTQQHALGIHPEDMYWKMVTPHEVAHQWWGHTVGFRSYRDQWMSEGFADESASIFLQATRPKNDDFLNFWKEERKMITEKNQFGFRAIDVGPVTMGYRLDSPNAGFNIARELIYPKGAYILHMVRMMMWTPQQGDARFKATMHDFVESHRLQPVTTEDFKAAVERHMSPGMNLDNNGTMDWFFNEYVYGTALPAYHFEGEATPNDKGVSLHFKLTQSGVQETFKMPVPLYLEYTDGKITRLGEINITGNKTIEQTMQLPNMPGTVKKVSINRYYDVLCVEN
jgi:aminopeptidase N